MVKFGGGTKNHSVFEGDQRSTEIAEFCARICAILLKRVCLLGTPIAFMRITELLLGGFMSDVNPSPPWSIAAVFAALTGGTVVRMVALRHARAEVAQSRFGSLRTWLGLAVVLRTPNKTSVALKDFISPPARKRIGKPTMVRIFLSIPRNCVSGLLLAFSSNNS